MKRNPELFILVFCKIPKAGLFSPRHDFDFLFDQQIVIFRSER